MTHDEYDYIYGNDSDDKGFELIPEPVCDEDYDCVYDEDGNEVCCDLCGGEMVWKNGTYLCSECGQVMKRADFFNYIGAEPPGKECLTCDNLYPGCVICPYGYVEED